MEQVQGGRETDKKGRTSPRTGQMTKLFEEVNTLLPGDSPCQW